MIGAIARRMLGRRGRESSISNPMQWLLEAFGGRASRSGMVVSDARAMESSAVLCAVRNLSEGIGQLPLHLYRKSETGNARRVRAEEHPLYRVLHLAPNPELTPIEFKAWIMHSMLFYGDAFCEVERTKSGKVIALWPLLAWRMKVHRDPKTRAITYNYTTDTGESLPIPKERLIHFRGYYTGGLVGLSLKRQGRESIGLGLSLEEYAAKIFKRGFLAGGVIKRKDSVTPEAAERIARTFYGKEGLEDAHRPQILDEDMDFVPTGVKPADAQMIESRNFQILEVCRVFNIQPHRLFELSRATFSNIEQMAMEFLIYTLGPWMVRIQERINVDLLSAEEQGQYYTEFMPEALLRTDIKTRYESYRLAIQEGIMTRDEVRDRENLNPYAEGLGSVPTIPVNMQALALAVRVAAPAAAPAGIDANAGTRGLGLTAKNAESTEKACGCGVAHGRRDASEEDEARRRKSAARLRVRSVWQGVFREKAAQLVRGVSREVRKLAKRAGGERATEHGQARTDTDKAAGEARALNIDALRGLLERYFADGGEGWDFVRALFSGAFGEYGAEMAKAAADEVSGAEVPDLTQFAQEYSDAFLRRMLGDQYWELIRAMEASEEPEAALEEVLTRWQQELPEQVSGYESVRFGDAAAMKAWVLLGVTRYAWLANGDGCPLCQQLNGQIVGVQQFFAVPGDTVDPNDGSTAPMTVSSRIGHAPLHKGCSCTVVAA